MGLNEAFYNLCIKINNMNEYAICELALVPVRLKSSEASEMVTQLLFGEIAKVLEVQEKWLKIELLHDKYKGWVDRKMVAPLLMEDYKILMQERPRIVKVPQAQVKTLKGRQVIPMGSLIRKGLMLNYRNTQTLDKTLQLSELPAVAKKLINVPYLWGGKTVFGMDCSGFMQVLFRLAGHDIPRDASQQATLGKAVKNIEVAKDGDMAFFGKPNKITHVGLIIGKNKIIHASGWVRKDTVDGIGIYNSDSKSYSHTLVSIRRLS